MVIYTVKWVADKVLTKGKGRVKHEENIIIFSVICNNICQAQRCFLWHFNYVFDYSRLGLTPDDGELSLKRSIVDSRNFSARYLLLDDMDVPINLHNPKDSLLRYANKFYSKY